MLTINVTTKSKGKNINSSLEKIKEYANIGILNKYGQLGVDRLTCATPKYTGTTSVSWYYKIERKVDSTSLVFCNSNIQNGVPIAIIIQYGHQTATKGWVEGRDYINPAIKPIIDELYDNIWGEIKAL